MSDSMLLLPHPAPISAFSQGKLYCTHLPNASCHTGYTFAQIPNQCSKFEFTLGFRWSNITYKHATQPFLDLKTWQTLIEPWSCYQLFVHCSGRTLGIRSASASFKFRHKHVIANSRDRHWYGKGCRPPSVSPALPLSTPCHLFLSNSVAGWLRQNFDVLHPTKEKFS